MYDEADGATPLHHTKANALDPPVVLEIKLDMGNYRTVRHLLNINKNPVQRLFQLKGWQVKKHPIGFRPRVQALRSVARQPSERWA